MSKKLFKQLIKSASQPVSKEPAELARFNGDVVVSKEGAAYATDGNISCE